MQGGSQTHYLLGLRILNMLVSEMNSPTAGRSLTQHRKTAVNFRHAHTTSQAHNAWQGPSDCLISFHTLCCCVVRLPCRDQSLYKVFQLALTALRHLHGTAADEKLKEQAVQLALQCLSFDFVGTCLDESSEDLGTIQVPSGEPDTAQSACTQAIRACRCSWCRLAGIWVPTLACTKPAANGKTAIVLISVCSHRFPARPCLSSSLAAVH